MMNATAEKKHQPLLFCVGSNHRTAAIATREQFFLDAEQIITSLKAMHDLPSIKELAILSTCNRCEIFGVVSSVDLLTPKSLQEIYVLAHQTAKPQQLINYMSLTQSLYTMTGLDAARHTFQVAASLDSLIPGETQITSQFKEALTLAKNAGTLGPYLGRLAQEALATSKKVRSNTDIGRHRVSISHAAIDLARRASDDLSSLRFLILGAGEMARVAAEYAASYKPKALNIANRTREHAFELTAHLGYGDAHGFDNLYQLIARSDVVISATSASGHVIHAAELQKAIKNRVHSPLFLIDIALPRDIDPKASELDDVYVFDIDDLKTVVESHLEKRKEALSAASTIVSDAVVSFGQWLHHQEVTPTMAAASQYYREILLRESAKTLAREHFQDLSAKQRESLDAMIEAVATKLTGDIATTLRRCPDAEDARALASALELVFKRVDPS
jgi:glutamyl-tRNA reductase